MEPYTFKEIDESGLQTLDIINEADKFNHWMYSEIKPYCTGRILEIGSGIGNISEFFLNDGQTIMLSDLRKIYCDKLQEKFEGHPQLMGIRIMDLCDPEFDTRFADLLGSFDSVFALNVVEHIFDDELAIRNCHKLLAPGGQVVILVPAHQTLYNGLDEDLEHYRRYSRKSMNAVITKSGFTLVHSRYFNAVGTLGWFISGKLQGNRTIPKSQLKFYNFFVPLIKLIDVLSFRLVGLSVISVGKK